MVPVMLRLGLLGTGGSSVTANDAAGGLSFDLSCFTTSLNQID